MRVSDTYTYRIPLFHSLQARIAGMVFLIITVSTILMLFYGFKKIETVTTFHLEHEGLLLSDTLGASIAASMAASDIQGLQKYIDRIVAARKKNDIEINIITCFRDEYIKSNFNLRCV